MGAGRDGGVRAVLLDRDGTLNQSAPEGSYITSPADVVLLPGAAAAAARLCAAGVLLAVVTNQRGVALGLMDESDVAAVNDRVAALLAAEGARVEGWYVCPHERGTCACRKPADGLLRAALADLDVPPARAAVVGDRCSDVEAGTSLGLLRVLLAGESGGCPCADAVVPDLAAAADLLLGPV